MLDVDTYAERAKRNLRLATGLFAVSLMMLALMIAVVVGVRSGFLARLIDHIVAAAQG